MNGVFASRAGRLTTLAAALLLAVFMMPSNDPSESVRRSLAFCARSLVPSLFVTMVLGKILSSGMGASSKHVELRLLLYGLVCGSPYGAMTARELCAEGCVSREKAAFLTSVVSGASAPFIVSYVGVTLLGSVKKGIFLLVGNTAVTIAWYAILKFADGAKEGIYINNVKRKTLPRAVAESAEAMTAICGCVVFFAAVADTVCRGIENRYASVLIRGFFELSGGVSTASGMRPGAAYVLSAVFLGWSGVCIHLQTRLAAGEDVKTGRYLLGQVFRASAMGLFALATKKYVI